jgi:coenzyme F420-0:L-glutamate ligase / coenzyme F420-1:gamma-L-glutamate ligase
LSYETLQTFLKSRRSVRRFLPQPVPTEVLESLLEAASWAPSAHNRQPWRFAVLTTLDAKERLAGALGAEFRKDLLAGGLPPKEVQVQVERSYNRITQAPAAILLSLDPSVMDSYPDEMRTRAEHQMAVQSVALAGGQLLLAAHAAGLGGVWICAPLFAPHAARQSLCLPTHWEPQALLLIGYPEKIPLPRARRPVSETALFY